MMQKLNKNPLAKFVETLTNLIEKNIKLSKSAASKMDQLKSEKIADQKWLIEIQQGQINKVQDTVKSEMKTWADIAKKNTNQCSRKQQTESSVKQAVRIVNEERKHKI
jgi:muramidase (phage lysozyme)